MRDKQSIGILCLWWLACLASGCSDDAVDPGPPALPSWLTEDSSENPPAESPSIALAENVTESAASAPAARASLLLSLAPGESYPLRKVVLQELTQASLNGVPQVSRSQLELEFSITVEAADPESRRLGVRYHRVQYTHDIAGEHVSYDSASPPDPIPDAALAYHGMVNQGFAFELGPSNQIVNVIGFREFLEQCLQHVPDEQRQRVMLDVEANVGENGVADFIDSTVGLLPSEIDKALGETWERTQLIHRPVPMQLHTVYTLTGLTDEQANINITGTVAPSTPLGQSGEENQPIRIVVQGGRTQGLCTLHRPSGLPQHSQVERVVEMSVELEGGLQFAQQKRTVTTVEAVLEADVPAATVNSQASGARFQ